MNAFLVFVRKYPYGVLIPTIVILLVLWQLAATHSTTRSGTWSSPGEMITSLTHDLFHSSHEHADQNQSKTLFQHIGLTAFRFALGFGIAAVVGVSIGFCLGISLTGYKLLHPVISLLRGLPSAAVWPLTALVLGFGYSSQVFIIAFGATWPILLSAAAGVRALPTEIEDCLGFIQLEWYRRWWLLLCWSLPSIFTGLEIGCGIAYLLAVTVEIFWPANGGLGWYLDFYRQGSGQPDRLFAGVLVVAIGGWLVNTFLHWARRRLIFWEGELREVLTQLPPARAKGIISRVRDARLRDILQTNTVTETIERHFNLLVTPTVLYQDTPYMFPSELEHILHVRPDSLGSLLQRDIVIAVPDGQGETKTIMFARSWINTAQLGEAPLALLRARHLTIGKIVRSCKKNVHYRHLWYRDIISDKLGPLFNAEGTIELIQRSRVILTDGDPTILVEEFVPL